MNWPPEKLSSPACPNATCMFPRKTWTRVPHVNYHYLQHPTRSTEAEWKFQNMLCWEHNAKSAIHENNGLTIEQKSAIQNFYNPLLTEFRHMCIWSQSHHIKYVMWSEHGTTKCGKYTSNGQFEILTFLPLTQAPSLPRPVGTMVGVVTLFDQKQGL